MLVPWRVIQNKSQPQTTVDGSEIPRPTTWDVAKDPVKKGFQLPTSTGEFTVFLNHQQLSGFHWSLDTFFDQALLGQANG